MQMGTPAGRKTRPLRAERRNAIRAVCACCLLGTARIAHQERRESKQNVHAWPRRRPFCASTKNERFVPCFGLRSLASFCYAPHMSFPCDRTGLVTCVTLCHVMTRQRLFVLTVKKKEQVSDTNARDLRSGSFFPSCEQLSVDAARDVRVFLGRRL